MLCFYLKDKKSLLESFFLDLMLAQFILSFYICSARTRQASQRCSNVRVVFLLTKCQILYRSPRAIHRHMTSSRCCNQEVFPFPTHRRRNITWSISAITDSLLICIHCSRCRKSVIYINPMRHSAR